MKAQKTFSRNFLLFMTIKYLFDIERFYDIKNFENMWKIQKMLLGYKYKGIYFGLGPFGLF